MTWRVKMVVGRFPCFDLLCTSLLAGSWGLEGQRVVGASVRRWVGKDVGRMTGWVGALAGHRTGQDRTGSRGDGSRFWVGVCSCRRRGSLWWGGGLVYV